MKILLKVKSNRCFHLLQRNCSVGIVIHYMMNYAKMSFRVVLFGIRKSSDRSFHYSLNSWNYLYKSDTLILPYFQNIFMKANVLERVYDLKYILSADLQMQFCIKYSVLLAGIKIWQGTFCELSKISNTHILYLWC